MDGEKAPDSVPRYVASSSNASCAKEMCYEEENECGCEEIRRREVKFVEKRGSIIGF